MYVWENKLLNIIHEHRQKEIGFNFNVMLNQGISKVLSYFSIMITILAMVCSKLLLEEEKLNKEAIYAAIGILGVIRNTNFNGGLNYLTSCKIVMERLEGFLRLMVLPERRVLPVKYVSEVSKDVEVERIKFNARFKFPELKTQKSSKEVFFFKKLDKRLIGSLSL